MSTGVSFRCKVLVLQREIRKAARFERVSGRFRILLEPILSPNTTQISSDQGGIEANLVVVLGSQN